ncbi:hypothetical protein E4T80_12510 [Muribacter muris]|uniref:Uncharacterized protein n=1 Tax=Muribacter muris TaxID=67855 RepID=A0A4Y9JRW2_9PAST|nr:hemagglutinin repeat-containing protein [Muribacter muris]MBF0786281.1 hemagglutinin repeat-containing protein [Muribacter muris]MBF0826358.1 hemagglutinin repeat-containing protein [Muribacter muris]TFV07216.1 hypothetical protein E4T80_12510 [Muribacter muris]
MIDLAQNLEQMMGHKGASDRLKAAQALGTAAKGYTTYQNIASGGALAKAEAGLGFSHKRASHSAYAEQSVGNTVNAQHINVKARSGDINAKQTAFTSRDKDGNRLSNSSVMLDAAKQVNLTAGQNVEKVKGKQQSSGAEVGVGASVGAQDVNQMLKEQGIRSKCDYRFERSRCGILWR